MICEKLAYLLRLERNPTDQSDQDHLEVFSNKPLKKIRIDENQSLSIIVYDNRSYITNEINKEVENIRIQIFKRKNTEKWKFAAQIVDRFCVILFFLTNSTLTMFIIILNVS